MKKDAFAKAIRRVYGDPQFVQITMTKADAYNLLCAVQLSSRHPHAPKSPTIQSAIATVRQIGNAMAGNDRDLKMLIEMGWQQAYDTK